MLRFRPTMESLETRETPSGTKAVFAETPRVPAGNTEPVRLAAPAPASSAPLPVLMVLADRQYD